MANVTFEMLGFLMLNEDFFVIKLTITVPGRKHKYFFYGEILTLEIQGKFKAYQHQGLLCFFFFRPILNV